MFYKALVTTTLGDGYANKDSGIVTFRICWCKLSEVINERTRGIVIVRRVLQTLIWHFSSIEIDDIRFGSDGRTEPKLRRRNAFQQMHENIFVMTNRNSRCADGKLSLLTAFALKKMKEDYNHITKIGKS